MTRTRSWSPMRWMLLAAGLCVAAPAPTTAVTDEEVFRDFRFNLINPGARSLGLGGAFIAVADDATAALANPAGLILLARPEFFTEIRDRKTDDSTIEQDFPGFVQLEILSETQARAVFSPSFFSYVHPWERFAAGVSRIEINKSSNTTRNSFSFIIDPNFPAAFEIGGNGRIETDLSVWNVSGAVKITDKISFGGTVALGVLNIKAATNNFVIDRLAIIDPNQDPNLAGVPQTVFDTSIDDKDTDVAFNAGVHWRPHQRISFGAVYRGGMEFEVTEFVGNDTMVPTLTNALFGGPLARPSVQFGSMVPVTFNTPASFGAGAAWRPVNALTLSLDWLRIKYEDLLEGFQPGLNVLTLDDGTANFTVEDADEFHFGAEYVFAAGTVPWAVRAGAFSDHNSRIFADFDQGFSTLSNNATFPERDTEIHYTIGTGVVVKERFQIDAAADISDISNEYVLSTIFRF